jgi:hypothetical protein
MKSRMRMNHPAHRAAEALLPRAEPPQQARGVQVVWPAPLISEPVYRAPGFGQASPMIRTGALRPRQPMRPALPMSGALAG